MIVVMIYEVLKKIEGELDPNELLPWKVNLG